MRARYLFAGVAGLVVAGGALSFASDANPKPYLILTLAASPDAPSSVVAAPADGSAPDHVLSAGLYAARGAHVSPDGTLVAFSGRKTENDPWSLWEVAIDGGQPQKLITGLEATDPIYIGPDRILFSGRQGANEDWALYTIGRDGSGLERVTHHPGDDVMPVILRDGRIAFVHRPANEAGPVRLLAIRPDGTGLELLEEASGGAYARGTGGAVPPTRHRRGTMDVIDVVATDARTVGRGLLSVVDTTKDVGWLYGIDANVWSDAPNRRRDQRVARLRVWSVGSVGGEVKVEVDGSFFVELPADMPFRLEILDAEGRTIRGPSDWLWVRPGEHRGCIGCHEPRGMAPPNRVPLAVERPASVLSFSTLAAR
jgi:hypothetical protein